MRKANNRVGRVEIKIKEQNGAEFKNFRSTLQANGVGAVGNRKFVLTGRPKITLVTGSYKYPDEMQFSLCMHKSDSPVFKERHETNWNVVEINMSLEQGRDLIEALYIELFGKQDQ